MSYILDALKKSEQERQVGQVPTINTLHQGFRDSRPRRWPWWVGVVALLLLATYGYVRFQNTSLSTSPETNQALSNQGPQTERAKPITAEPVEAPRPSPAEQHDLLKERGTKGDGASQSNDILAVKEHELERLRRRPEVSIPPKSGTVVFADKELDHQPQEQVSEEKDPRPLPTGDRLADLAETDGEKFTDIPLLLETDFKFQQSIPDLKLDVHVYADSADERFVFINMNKYREGEQTREGILIEAIAPQGVIMDYQGTRFRIINQ